MITCPGCGRSVDDHQTAACPDCGAALIIEVAPDPPPAEEASGKSGLVLDFPKH